MTVAEWRALLEAFIEGRIGPDAFERRFLDAWREERDNHLPSPPAIESLMEVVDAYCGDPDLFKPGDADEAELREAARRALARLNEGGAEPTGGFRARTYDRVRAREDIRRFQVQMNQIVGLGCFIALAWIGLCLLQIFAVSDQVQSALAWPAALATFAGVILAFVPFLGNVIAFFGARDVWDWPTWTAALVFFAAPALTLLTAWLRWVRWARRP